MKQGGRVNSVAAGRELLAAGLLVAVATAIVNALVAPREAFWAFGALFFISTVVLGGVVWRNRTALEEMSTRRALRILLVVALFLRLSALVAPVSLSDDIWRYLWDGERVADGENPYAETPAEYLERAGADDEMRAHFQRLNSPQTHTLYPPLAQGVFAAAMILEDYTGIRAQAWLRLIFVLFDLGAVALLALLLIRRQIPIWWAALYGWHPLVYWEVAAGVHTEALGMVFLVMIVWAAMGKRPVATGAAIALAGLAKWTFLAVSPVVGLFLWRRYGFFTALMTTTTALVVSAAAYFPFYFPGLVENHGASLRLYAESFSFNSPVYYTLRFFLGYREGVTEAVTHITGPLLTGATILTIAIASLYQNGRTERLSAGIALALTGYIAFSPVFHPWYALPLLMAGALARWTTPAVLGAVVALSYAYYAPWSDRNVEIALMSLQVVVVSVWAMREWGPRLIEHILRRRGAAKAEAIAEVLGGEALRILDLGGAEGFVAEALSRQGHEVEIADVVDRNRTTLPAMLYDGEQLPVADRAFDLVVLSYVLHHAHHPDRVLSEALRVGREVVILETVFEAEWDRRLVTVLDHLANAMRGMRPEPLAFDRAQGWIQRIEDQGGEVLHWQWLGRGIHRHIRIHCRR